MVWSSLLRCWKGKLEARDPIQALSFHFQLDQPNLISNLRIWPNLTQHIPFPPQDHSPQCVKHLKTTLPKYVKHLNTSTPPSSVFETLGFLSITKGAVWRFREEGLLVLRSTYIRAALSKHLWHVTLRCRLAFFVSPIFDPRTSLLWLLSIGSGLLLFFLAFQLLLLLAHASSNSKSL